MLANELREMSLAELNTELIALHRELLGLRIQRSNGEVANPHLFKRAKRKIAQIKTLLCEKASKQR